MEWSSPISGKWLVCALGSIFGWLILLLVNQNGQNVGFPAARNTITLEFASLQEQEPPTSTNVVAQRSEQAQPSIVLTPPLNITRQSRRNIIRHNVEKPPKNKATEKKTCNMFVGKWVFKPEEKSMYDSISCPFIEEKLRCQRNGRPDFNYEKWVWEAIDCDIPSFNGTNMLERLRNKRLIMVGDSLNRNMWESLSCLLYTSIPASRAQVHADDPTYKIFKAQDYNCIVEFYWSPFLVELNENHESGKKVLVVDKLSPNSKQWKGADVMVFNSGHWWTHMGKYKAWDLFQFKGQIKEEMPIEVAYERGMKTWATWIEENVNSKKTKVFFRSISALHNNGNQWCYNSTKPIEDESYKNPFPKSLMNIIENLINNMSKIHLVKYLNITKLSQYRLDAHPSVYRRKSWKIYIKKYEKSLKSYVDCSHWCLPGLPDTWNRLLYDSL